jgi:hypothetical protein
MHHMDIFHLPPGVNRRKKLVDWLKGQQMFVGLPVNRKYQFAVKKDRDLIYLLKKGVLKQIRVRNSLKCRCHQSYLVLAE